jgi:succinoglycan biosynthesis transport protein ExoP
VEVVMKDSKPISIAPYFDIIYRHRYGAFGVFAVGMAATISLAVMLHAAYESTAMILIEPAQIAADYVSIDAAKASANLSVADQLEALAYKAFSQERLEQLIRKFGLYGYQPGNPLEPRINRLQSKLHLVVPQDTIVYETGRPGDRAPGVLKISFEYDDRIIAQRVTQELADTYVEEGYRERIRRTDDAVRFLTGQVAQVDARLEAKDSQIKQLEQRYEGSLPQELEPNLAELARLQDQLSMINQELTTEHVIPLAAGPTLATSPAQELTMLELKLTQLRSEYRDEYPDVIVLKKQIRDLRAQIRSETSSGGKETSESGDNIGAGFPRLEQEAAGLTVQIEGLKARIAITPVHQQELEGLQRDYDAIASEYHGLLNKKLAAQLNESLEKRHQEERLQLLEPASLPRKPIRPNRGSVGLLGFCFSAAAALGLPFGLYFTDTSFKEPEELQNEFSLPVLAAIPMIELAGDSRIAILRTLAASSTGILVAVAAIWAYTHHLFF